MQLSFIQYKVMIKQKMEVYGQISIGVYFDQLILYRKSFESDDCSFLSVYFFYCCCMCVWGAWIADANDSTLCRMGQYQESLKTGFLITGH